MILLDISKLFQQVEQERINRNVDFTQLMLKIYPSKNPY